MGCHWPKPPGFTLFGKWANFTHGYAVEFWCNMVSVCHLDGSIGNHVLFSEMHVILSEHGSFKIHRVIIICPRKSLDWLAVQECPICQIACLAKNWRSMMGLWHKSTKTYEQLIYPIGSMYAIYGNIYRLYTPNVSIYTIHGSYGYCYLFFSLIEIGREINWASLGLDIESQLKIFWWFNHEIMGYNF